MTPPVLWYLSPLSLGTAVSYPVDCAVCSPRFSGEPSFRCPIPAAIMGVLLSNLCSRDLCPPTCPAGSLLPQFLHFVLLFSQAFLLPSRFVCLASTPQNLSKGNSLLASPPLLQLLGKIPSSESPPSHLYMPAPWLLAVWTDNHTSGAGCFCSGLSSSVHSARWPSTLPG